MVGALSSGFPGARMGPRLTSRVGGVSSWGSLQTIWAVEELAGAGPGSAWAAVGEAGMAAYF